MLDSGIDKINKDLILREKLALQRTILANQTTFLAFLRTSMYFLIAGLSVKNLLQVENSVYYEILLFSVSAIVFIYGLINYINHKRKIKSSEIHIGNYKAEYEK
jgi:putative membrane protein